MSGVTGTVPPPFPEVATPRRMPPHARRLAAALLAAYVAVAAVIALVSDGVGGEEGGGAEASAVGRRLQSQRKLRMKVPGPLGSVNDRVAEDDGESGTAVAGNQRGGQQRRMATNMFDCDALPDEDCTYFRPVAFFESENGTGRAYINETEPWRTRHRKKTNYLRLIRTDSYLKPSSKPRPSLPSSAPLVPPELVYIHIHKNGGTSVRNAMRRFRNVHRREGYRLDEYYAQHIRELSESQLRSASSQFMRQVAWKQGRGDKDAAAFTFVRDPIRKFLSATGQVMLMGKLTECHGMRGRDLADCAASFLSVKGLNYDIHFKPQVLELYDCVRGTDVAVSLLDMRLMGSFIHEGCLGLKEVTNSKRKLAVATTEKFFPADGGEDPVSLLDDDTMKKVCKLYKVDVVFFRSIGREVPECDPHIANVVT